MVSPYYILAIGLGLAFLIGIAGSKLKNLNTALVGIAFGALSFISISWVLEFLFGNAQQTFYFSAGFKPPFSISLMVGFYEAIIISMINILGLFSIIYLWKSLKDENYKLAPILLILFMALDMLILTQDIFNIFVFIEITAIALSGVILIQRNNHSYSAGFKYLLAVSLISAFYLLGVVLIYFFTGTLYLQDLVGIGVNASPVLTIAIFLTIIAILLELKPFPANGWALDVYQGAHPSVGAIVSSGVATTMLFVLYKLSFIGHPLLNQMMVAIGLITFLFSNWLGISQKDVNRLLGYSSIGQIGLIIALIGMKDLLGNQSIFIIFGILVTHFLAKSGLFWISGLINKSSFESFAPLRKHPVLLVLFGIFLFALAAFPPFPSFFAKWDMIMLLAKTNQYWWIIIILAGSFFELLYLIRLFGAVVKGESKETEDKIQIGWFQYLPLILFALALPILGYFSQYYVSEAIVINYLPLIAVVALALIDFLPTWIKNTLLIAAVAYYGYLVLPLLDSFAFIFGAIFITGAILTLLYGYSVKGKRIGFYPLVAMMFAGLMLLVEAKDLLNFFFAWEIMTAGSYFLILRGKNSQPHALSYMLFSFGGALLILIGFAIAHALGNTFSLDALIITGAMAPIVFILLTIGFLTKTAAIGLHIWLPGAHSEAEADVSPMVSGILLKAGVYGLIILFLRMGQQCLFGIDLMQVLSWIAVVTAIGGYLMASMQEDMKRLLAYSSVGQLGIILFGLSLMTHLGWLLALAGSITHFLNKTMLFQAVGGVYSRTHDRMMYRMGGLIFRMPLTFIVVLIGIISMSGVPPLTGFAGKWLSFNAILEKGYYLQGAAMVLAGAVAFLYLFRLIHAPFLGQLKDHLRKVKEASLWILLPQFLIIMIIMVLSTYPGMLLEPIGKALYAVFPEGALTWKESVLPFGARTAISPFGYWNGTYVMVITVGIFAILLGIQLLIQRRNKKVGQFNIVYSAERPSTPETTHHAYNFYAHYQKAVGFLIAPIATNFWNAVSDIFHSISHQVRQIYNGNGQTYVLHILVYLLICYYFINGGF